MPYFITDSSPDCSGWATIDDNGAVLGCHQSKEDAIDQMIAVSLAEDIAPGGERIKKPKKKLYRLLPDNYRPALSDTVPEGRACGNCYFYREDMQNEEGNKAWCEKWEDYVDGGYYCNAWQPDEDDDEDDRATPDGLKVGDFVSWNSSGGKARGKIEKIVRDGSINVPNSSFTITGTPDNPAALIAIYQETENGYEKTDTKVGHKFSTLTKINDLRYKELRDLNIPPTSYMRAAARRGLQLNAEGKGGDGLTDKTIREARDMAAGKVSDDKWIRLAAWIARHLVDLDAPKNNNPSDNQYPGAGLVAHLLWGSGPSKSAAQRTMKYAEGVVERIRKEQEANGRTIKLKTQNSDTIIKEDNKQRWSSLNINLDVDSDQETKVERRIKTDIDFELRVENAEIEGMRFTGYAAVFNSDSEPLPFIETISPGAFKKSLRSRNEIKMFMNHNMDYVLGSTRSKTLRIKEDDKGLLVSAILPNTTVGRDLSVLMQRGDVHAMSFGFSVPRGGDKYSEDGTKRVLNEIRLHEVSIVTGFPAYEATTASVRTIEILARRTNVDADALSDALLRLEAGENLQDDQAALITEVVQKLKVDSPAEPDLLGLKRKQLDLMLKGI
jgi:HK97 family phage prohead protease